MRNTVQSFIIVAICISLYVSCKKDSPAGTGGTAHFNLYLTDAPAEYDAVYIDVQSVEIHSNEAGWQTLGVINPGIYDLLQFNSGVDTLIISEDISPRTITQIRLILGENNSVIVDGVSHPLETPSAETSGLKLNVSYTFEAGVIYDLWLDFDAEQSIVEQGNGDYSLKPVIHIYTEAESGAISGSISPVNGAYYVKATTPTDTIGTYLSDEGTFLIGGVPAGTYSVTFSANDGFLDVTVPGVAVQTGSVTDMGVVNIPL